jgi:ABC-type bacteriocin/lantibiotic exporter with double-glycine peptidase domain
VGGSGAGKSTLTDLLLGTLDPVSGKISVDNVDIRNVKSAWWKKIGFVSQRLNLLEDSIRQNIVLGEENYPDEKLWEVLRAVELDGLVKGMPNGLDSLVSENGLNISGGQKQRLLIARVLFKEPEILIMDEATSSLDSKVELQIVEELLRIKQGMTIIFITHKESMLKYCNKVFRVENKKIRLTKRENL